MSGYVSEPDPSVGRRANTPESLSRIRDIQKTPPVAKSDLYQKLFINLNWADVIYAEDDATLRGATVHDLVKSGFSKHNIQESESALDFLERLVNAQFLCSLTRPLVVILNVGMLAADGRDTALHIQELSKNKLLRREPFVISVSSLQEQVSVHEGTGNVQVVPKPLDSSRIDECIRQLTHWWTNRHCCSAAVWKAFSVTDMDLIIASDEPLSLMHAVVAFGQVGVSQEQIAEAEDEEELFQMLSKAQEGVTGRPLVLVLMRHEWAVQFQTLRSGNVDTKHKLAMEFQQWKRQPFIIYADVDVHQIGKWGTAQMSSYVDAFAPFNFDRKDILWCIKLLRLWWQTRGDGRQDLDAEISESKLPLDTGGPDEA